MRNLLAFDLGASNGRAILGQFDGEKITMRELHRFENNYIEMNGVFYWDLPYLYNQLKQGLLAFKNANVGELDCIGIDTWGVDYGLLDKNGQLLSNPRSYRYAVDAERIARQQLSCTIGDSPGERSLVIPAVKPGLTQFLDDQGRDVRLADIGTCPRDE